MDKKSYQREDQIVALLSGLGIHYLSYPEAVPEQTIEPKNILPSLVDQPSSRVRTAVIALLLLRPEFARDIPEAVKLGSTSQQDQLKLFYSAAVFLQRKYEATFRQWLGDRFQWLPDLFSAEFSISSEEPADDCLQKLAIQHGLRTGRVANWYGTYHSVYHQLIRRQNLESLWSQSTALP